MMYKSVHIFKTRGRKVSFSLLYMLCTKNHTPGIFCEEISHTINARGIGLLCITSYYSGTISHYLQLYLRCFVNFPLYIHFGVISKQHRNHRFHRSVELNEGGSGIQFVQLSRRYC